MAHRQNCVPPPQSPCLVPPSPQAQAQWFCDHPNPATTPTFSASFFASCFILLSTLMPTLLIVGHFFCLGACSNEMTNEHYLTPSIPGARTSVTTKQSVCAYIPLGTNKQYRSLQRFSCCKIGRDCCHNRQSVRMLAAVNIRFNHLV
jgi:hypothetical protein